MLETTFLFVKMRIVPIIGLIEVLFRSKRGWNAQGLEKPSRSGWASSAAWLALQRAAQRTRPPSSTPHSDHSTLPRAA